MGTNYYVDAPSCPNACEHCGASERLHLGKSSIGWRFLFRAEPDWLRSEAFGRWMKRAQSGRITDEYGDEITLAQLLKLVDAKADGIDHLARPAGRQYGAPSASDFKSSGHDFCDREFS